MENYTVYTVMEGDTLSGVAQNHKLPSHTFISDHNRNRSLMQTRGGPNNIQVGDRLFIPENPIKLLENQLESLKQMKQGIITSFEESIRSQDQNFASVNRTANNVDAAAIVAQVTVNLGKLVHQGYKNLALSGKALSDANKKLLISQAKDKVKGVAENVAQGSSLMDDVDGSEGKMLAIGKIAVQSWFNMTTPSYWAGRFANVDINQLHQQTIAHLNEQKKYLVQNIDLRIRDKSNAILKLRNDLAKGVPLS